MSTNPLLTHTAENESSILHHVDSDKVTLEYLNTYAELHLAHPIVDLSLIPHSSSYFGNPMVESPPQKDLDIYEIENGEILELPPAPPEFEE
ncbi:hypothetical protein KI387_001563, partial [Taxus chinensis]